MLDNMSSEMEKVSDTRTFTGHRPVNPLKKCNLQDFIDQLSVNK